MVGAVLSVVLASACSSSDHRDTSPSTSVAPPRSPATTAATTAPVESARGAATTAEAYAWQRADDPALAIGGGSTTTISAVLAPMPIVPTSPDSPPSPSTLSTPWRIAGTAIAADGGPTATLWSSANGLRWARTPLTGPTEPSQATAAAEWHNTTVVVGSVGVGASQRAAVWISTAPGSSFRAVSVPAIPGVASMGLVTAGPLGLFAAGGANGKVAFWSSTDGTHWTEDANAEKIVSASVDPRINALLAEGDVVYAAGSTQAGGSTEAALWTSGDGINWHRVDSAQAVFGGEGDRVITALAPLGTGLVAVGGMDGGSGWSPVSWISPNGASWSQPSASFPMSPRAGEGLTGTLVRAVSAWTSTSGSTELVAVGGSSTAQRVWNSSDGVVWSEVPLPAASARSTAWRATLVASMEGATVVADGDPGQPHVLVNGTNGWTQPSANPGVFGPVQPMAWPQSLAKVGDQLELTVELYRPAQAIGAASTTLSVLTSDDGRDWAAPAASTAATVASLVPPALPTGATAEIKFGSEWVAVGQGGSTPTVSTSSPNPLGMAVAWTSAASSIWSPRGALDRAPGISFELPEGVCSSRSARSVPSLAAVGAGDLAGGGYGPLAWTSTNGVVWRKATVTPPAPAGAAGEMAGCLGTPSGLVAYGQATGPTGVVPVLWTSATGSSWSERTVSAFGPGTPAPLTGLAVDGSTWLAVAGAPVVSSGSLDAGEPLGGGPGLAAASGLGGSDGVGAPSGIGLWTSTDGGITWRVVRPTGPAWTGVDAAAGVVAFAGSDPVIAGSVDGRVAVWVGTPVAGEASTPTEP